MGCMTFYIFGKEMGVALYIMAILDTDVNDLCLGYFYTRGIVYWTVFYFQKFTQEIISL